MYKTKLSPNTIKPKTKSNIIPFPTYNNGNVQVQTHAIVIRHHNQEKDKLSQSTVEEKDDNILLVFETLLVLKEQLDSIQIQLNSLPKS